MSLLILGGLYHALSQSFSDEQPLVTLRSIGINTVFLSSNGIHNLRGSSCSKFYEVTTKPVVVKNAIQKIVLADFSKFGVVKPMFFADLQDVNAIATGDELNWDDREELMAGFPHLQI
ncbi:hypothetical protein B4916_16155 [Yersinia intermedia]|nr:hypothetical protein B4916_16155 [Yersinia intermedia]